jgi:polar amino acid transport system permease protein
VNVAFIADAIPMYGRAIVVTLRIAVLGILFSLVIGAICALVKYCNVRATDKLAKGYIELSRNTPLVIQLFFLYYGLPKLGVMLSNETCAVIGLSFLGGSYMAESFRAGLEAVSKV